MHSAECRAREAHVPTGPRRSALEACKKQCFSLYSGGVRAETLKLPARRTVAPLGVSWRRLVRATHKIHYFLVLPGGASAGCRGPPLSGGNPQLTSAQDRGVSWRQLASPTNDPRLMQNAAKGPHIVAGRRKTTQHRCRTQQNDIKLMQHAHALENEVLL